MLPSDAERFIRMHRISAYDETAMAIVNYSFSPIASSNHAAPLLVTLHQIRALETFHGGSNN